MINYLCHQPCDSCVFEELSRQSSQCSGVLMNECSCLPCLFSSFLFFIHPFTDQYDWSSPVFRSLFNGKNDQIFANRSLNVNQLSHMWGCTSCIYSYPTVMKCNSFAHSKASVQSLSLWPSQRQFSLIEWSQSSLHLISTWLAWRMIIRIRVSIRMCERWRKKEECISFCFMW